MCLNLLNILKTYSSNENNFFLEFPAHIINNFDQLKNCIFNIKSLDFIMAYHIPTDIEKNVKMKMNLIIQLKTAVNILTTYLRFMIVIYLQI